MIDTNAEYIYLPSAVEADRQAPGGRPFWVGERKLVRFQWAEKELRLLEVDTDERWKDNTANSKVVLTIPVQHLDYRCAKDKYGECTNKEEKVDDVSFDQKSTFKPDMAGTAIKEVDLMPIELENLFMGGCYSETHSELIGYRLDSDGLNLQIERTYQASPYCVAIFEWEDLNNLSFKARFNYSVVRLSSLKTPNYQAISYPKEDEGTFGFFTTEKRRLGVDNQDTVKGVEVLMNRWNPNRGQVVYNLSPAFAKPENKAILESTYRVVEKLNKGLSQANAGIQVKLEMPKGKISGDLHHSEIVLIEDPMKVGLLGYGPSITDPKTGEILWARVAMYSGVMKQFIWREYNALVAEKKAELAQAASAQISLSPELVAQMQPGAEPTDGAPPSTESFAELLKTNGKSALGKTHVKSRVKVSSAQVIHGVADASTPTSSFMSSTLKAELKKEMKRLNKDNLIAKMLEYMRSPNKASITEDDKTAVRAEISKLDPSAAVALIGAYPAELYNFQAAISTAKLEDILDGDLVLWEDLTDDQRSAIVEKVLPIVWEATLIHEIGHTLGLRHNFSGSEDKANFYTAEELAAMGIDKPVPYSSIMEYPYTDVSALDTVGKYDIAALRYGYARNVELTDGSIVNLGTDSIKSAALTLKEYKFCTDEHAGANANCNRFDEGTTHLEIAKQLIEGADRMYKVRNYRNGRRNFSLYNDLNYIYGVDDRIFDFRLFFERYASLQARFKIPLDVWKGESCPDDKFTPADCEFLVDIYSSVSVGLNYMTKTLTTPDTICAVARTANPNVITDIVPLKDINDEEMDCFHLKLPSSFVVVGEIGRSFKSRKASDNENSYADQVDVRGIWGDKIVALDYMLNRRLGSSLFDDDVSTYLENSDLRATVLQSLVDVILDQPREVEIVIPSTGQKIPVNLNYSLADTHDIPEPLDSGLARVLGLRNGMTPFVYQVGRALALQVPHPTMPHESAKTLELFVVHTCVDTELANSKCPSAASTAPNIVAIGPYVYVATSNNKVAQVLISQIKDLRAQAEAIKTKEIPEMAAKIAMYEALTGDQLVKVFKLLKEENPDLTTLTPAEKAVYDMGLEQLLQYARSELSVEALEAMIVDLQKVVEQKGIALEALPERSI